MAPCGFVTGQRYFFLGGGGFLFVFCISKKGQQVPPNHCCQSTKLYDVITKNTTIQTYKICVSSLCISLCYFLGVINHKFKNPSSQQFCCHLKANILIRDVPKFKIESVWISLENDRSLAETCSQGINQLPGDPICYMFI
jgi:hypothetical protein